MADQGLVKKLLFPAYTDAGSNESFQPTPKQEKQTAVEGSAEEDVMYEEPISEASTAVHENLSNRPPPGTDDNDLEARKTPLLDNRSTPRNGIHLIRPFPLSIPVQQRAHHHQQQPPPFFASTRPPLVQSAVSKIQQHGQVLKLIDSPPILPRTARSSSNVAVVSLGDQMEDDDDENDDDDDDDLLAGEQRSSPSIFDRIDSCEVQVDCYEDAEYPESPGEEATGKFPDDTSSHDDEGGGSVEEVPASAVLIRDEFKFDTDAIQRHDDKWEEEATPDQTAFGKQLLFRRVFREEGDVDALSTASERGTLIEEQQREDELEGPDHWEENQNEDAHYSENVWEKELLSLPILDERVGEEVDEKKLPDKHEGSYARKMQGSSMFSQAIKKLGSGIAGNTKQHSVSAPTTPQRPVATFLSLPRALSTDDASPTNHEAPSSFLLRSPGSSAFVAARSSSKKNRQKQQHQAGRRGVSIFERIPEDQATTESRHIQRSAASAFQLARSCFSFDQYDPMDDVYDVPPERIYNSVPNWRKSNEVVRGSSLPSWGNSNEIIKESKSTGYESKPSSWLRSSASWDFGGGSSKVSTGQTIPSSKQLWRSPGGPFRRKTQQELHHGNRVSSGDFIPKGRMRSFSDISTSVGNSSNAVELKTPQRVDIEREDALDILACLVDRGISVCAEEHRDEIPQDESSVGRNLDGDIVVPSSLDVSKAISDIQQILESSVDDESLRMERLLVLKELKKSHNYAEEMRRASRSAYAWLKSTGRYRPSSKTTAGNNVFSLDKQADISSESMDLVTIKAQLHRAELEMKDKTELADRLNEELAKCRAEIGRLRSTAHGNSFRSPNRSILDESDDYSGAEVEESEFVRGLEDTSPINSVDESSFVDGSLLPKNHDNVRSQQTLQEALEEANKRICEMFEELKRKEPSALGDKEKAPVVKVPDLLVRSGGSPGQTETRTVNVQMLDGENFVTDWDDLSPPLPPPPDHGVRSPIVEAVLGQWTNDAGLHSSLLLWLDQVLNGVDPTRIPPLTLTNLDHQVRDGFTMHVFPLLLRRADIKVDVKLRAHRTTKYDLSIAVEKITSFTSPSASIHRSLENGTAYSEVGGQSTTLSSATTAVISNGAAGRLKPIVFSNSFPPPPHHVDGTGATSSRVSYDEMAEYIAASSVDGHHAGLISALGGAIGGLLNRRKIDQESPRGGQQNPGLDSPRGSAPVPEPNLDVVGLIEEERDQPYHRVVSAPPGRIGVTFVEYRGHAMVSDVNPDSPLVGWIFPSDILIAIDELPVSGLRIREIIKVLKDRKDRQRALRVISSHAINEFTSSLNTSSAYDGQG